MVAVFEAMVASTICGWEMLKSPRSIRKPLRVAGRLRSGFVVPICAPPNISLQRTPSASPPSPLSSGTLGSRELPSALSAGDADGKARHRGWLVSVPKDPLQSERGKQERFRGSAPLEFGRRGQFCALPNTALQPTSSASPPPRLSAKPLAARG